MRSDVLEKAIPCAITMTQTQNAARVLSQKFPQEFAGREIEQRIRTEVTANNASRADVIDNLLAERLVTDLKDSFALTKAEIMRWGQYFRKHKSAAFLLPVCYLNRRTETPPLHGTFQFFRKPVICNRSQANTYMLRWR